MQRLLLFLDSTPVFLDSTPVFLDSTPAARQSDPTIRLPVEHEKECCKVIDNASHKQCYPSNHEFILIII
ncbi:hypothetical protein DDI_2780 [Dickeya dianthicola RNS04.9]|nr:hypothetical protein DDI_2780 [Dickeya dianthicola RNS04.9]